MPRNGSGTYSRVPGSAYTNATLADGTELDTEMADIATALTNSVAKNGETAMTGNLNMGGNGLTNVGTLSISGNIQTSAAVVTGNGTSAAPSISFVDDRASGFYQPAAYSVSFVTNGTRAITIDSAQKVGIGTNTPSDLLHVAGNIRTTGNLNIYSTSVLSGYLYGNSSGLLNIRGGSAGVRLLDSAGYSGITVSNSSGGIYSVYAGRVGGATTDTSGFFHIQAISGTPTGVPAMFESSFVPIRYDKSAKKLWIYDGGWISSGVFS